LAGASPILSLTHLAKIAGKELAADTTDDEMVPSIHDPLAPNVSAKPCRRANNDIKRLFAFAALRSVHCLQEEAKAAGISCEAASKLDG
jgi:hypothetical protein